ncbi:hypothetical protein EYF80_052921 [Liparis tanakae]|uniref:Uncharacterized protein n=1 Tax=Liparis tanakae TaxID=230148 RepID=A0A4Z2F700_9TELE|nr:hypothetical protein EYF80_052921 [Liparis tanakae]
MTQLGTELHLRVDTGALPIRKNAAVRRNSKVFTDFLACFIKSEHLNSETGAEGEDRALRWESQSALSCSAVDESNWLLLPSWRRKRKSFPSSETFTELCAAPGIQGRQYMSQTPADKAAIAEQDCVVLVCLGSSGERALKDWKGIKEAATPDVTPAAICC